MTTSTWVVYNDNQAVPRGFTIAARPPVEGFMNKKDQKIVRRTGSSFFFGGMSLFLFFPYARVTWNIVLFLSALCGVTIAAFALIRVNRRRAAGETTFDVKTRRLSTAAWWLTLVPFIFALVGLILTGILACSVYAG